MNNTLDNKFKQFIVPYLKEYGLKLEDGFSIEDNYRVDYVVKSESGYYTHIFEVKNSFSTEALNQLNRYRAMSFVGAEKKQVPFFLVCYNGGNWDIYDINQSIIPINTLFSHFVVAKNRKQKKIFIPKLVCYVIALLMLTVCVLELFPSLCESIVPISREVAFLLCASGIFAVLPMIITRIKEIHFESSRLVIVLNENHKE